MELRLLRIPLTIMRMSGLLSGNEEALASPQPRETDHIQFPP